MPKLELKTVQKDLEAGTLWPLYWIHGQERMKSRELLKRIRKAALGDDAEKGEGAGFGAETILEGAEVEAAAVLDEAQSLSFGAALGGGSGLKLVIVREAHALKNAEALTDWLGPARPRAELAEAKGSVIVCLSKDLDGRKKFSKTLVEKAAVIECAEVPEAEREAWIGYLAKRRGPAAVALDPATVTTLLTLDPWTLDIVDQEIEKIALLGADDQAGILLEGGLSFASQGGSDPFFEAFFMRKLAGALPRVRAFADRPDEALPLLGLLSWNVRQIALLCADREKGTRSAKLSPYLADKLTRWSKGWKLAEISELQSELCALDFGFKQTPLLPLGLWAELVMRFCR